MSLPVYYYVEENIPIKGLFKEVEKRNWSQNYSFSTRLYGVVTNFDAVHQINGHERIELFEFCYWLESSSCSLAASYLFVLLICF